MIVYVQVGDIDLWHARPGEQIALDLARDHSPIEIDREQADARWSSLCAQNPRLFGGPISAVTSFDPQSMRMTWRENSYKLLAVQDEVDTGTWQLSVTALLVAGDGSDARVLLGRRSPGVHTYPGLWEFGPSGGVDPPAGKMDRRHLLNETRREIREEIGLDLKMDRAPIVGVFRDANVRSYDVLVRVPVQSPREIVNEDWEYAEVGWFTPGELVSLNNLCPPSAVVASRIETLIAQRRDTRHPTL